MPGVNRLSRQSQLSRNATDSAIDHAAAAAVTARERSGADIVTTITWNLKHFDRKELAAVRVVTETPEAFLCRLLADSQDDVIAAFMRMRANLRNPPKTNRECAETLAAQGLKKFARLISARVE